MWPGHLALTHILSSQALGDYNPLFTPYPGHPLLLWPTGCGQKEDTSPPDHSTRRPPLYHRIMHEASITHTTGDGGGRQVGRPGQATACSTTALQRSPRLQKTVQEREINCGYSCLDSATEISGVWPLRTAQPNLTDAPSVSPVHSIFLRNYPTPAFRLCGLGEVLFLTLRGNTWSRPGQREPEPQNHQHAFIWDSHRTPSSQTSSRVPWSHREPTESNQENFWIYKGISRKKHSFFPNMDLRGYKSGDMRGSPLGT